MMKLPRGTQLFTKPFTEQKQSSFSTYNVQNLAEETMMASEPGDAFLITGPLWGESTDRWIPLTKGQ